MNRNCRLVFLFLCLVAFVMVVKNNSKLSVQAKEGEKFDIYMTEDIKTERYEIFTGDYSTYKGKVAKSIEIDQSLPLIEILSKVVTSLSETIYDGLPIEISIEDRNSKNVAIINLVEPLSSNNKEFKKLYEELEDKKGTWQNYFDKSEAKSIVTNASLNETLKQVNTKGKWIDGYMIYHNGETLVDHRNLSTTDITWIRK